MNQKAITVLIDDGSELDKPLLTVSLEAKWYCLYLITPTVQGCRELDDIRKIEFEELEAIANGNESAFCDHVPNPHVVVRYAERKNYRLDHRALEMIIGRWELEYPANPKYRYPET